MKTDTLFYRLFQDRPALVFALAGIPLPADANYVLRAEEIKETAFRLDGLLVAADPGAHPLVFLEVQFQSDEHFYARWFAEIYLYLYRRAVKGEWRAVVIYPRRAVESPESAAYDTTLVNPWVHRVYLNEPCPPSAATTPGLGLIQLILAAPELSAARAKDLLDDAGDERDWILDWVETILVYKLPTLSREDIRMLLDLKDTDLQKTRFYQEVYAEGREEGRRAEVALVLRQLRRHLGPLSGSTERRIAASTSAELEALGEALLDFSQHSDLDAWLEAHAR